MLLFRWRGVPVVVDPLFLLLLAGIFLLQLSSAGLTGLVLGAVAALMVFASILAHELGHAAVAMRLGIRVFGIRLHIFGGHTLFAAHDLTARRDLWVSLAGPAVSLALAAVGLLGFALLDSPVLGAFAWFNGVLALFNLVPAYPLDGGRALRAVLQLRLGQVRGSKLALDVGFVLTALLFVVAVLAWRVELAVLAVLMFGYQQSERAALGRAA